MNDFDKYQINARKTADYPKIGSGIVYPAIGIGGEAGEVLEQIKKVFRDDGGILTEERKQKIIKEMGDELWYLANLATELDVNFSHIAEENLKKLWKC